MCNNEISMKNPESLNLYSKTEAETPEILDEEQHEEFSANTEIAREITSRGDFTSIKAELIEKKSTSARSNQSKK